MALGYRRAEITTELPGFGFLVPKKERRRLVACTVVHNKFSYRVAPDKVVLRCFFGGAADEGVLGEVFGIGDDVTERMERSGYVKIDASGIFTGDKYVEPYQIASVDGDTVRLIVDKDDIEKPA